MPALFISKTSHLYSLKMNIGASKKIDKLTSMPAPKALLIIDSNGTTISASVITGGLKNNNLAVEESKRNLMHLDDAIAESFKISKTLIATFMAHGIQVTSNHDTKLNLEAIDLLAPLLQHQTIPIVQLSIIKNATPAAYYLLGQVLANLRIRGVLL